VSATLFFLAVTGVSFLIERLLLRWPYWSVAIPPLIFAASIIFQEPDLFDLWFRVERAFGARFDRSALGLWDQPGSDMTAGQLHDRVCDVLREIGTPVPRGSWRKVQLVIADATGLSPRSIRRDSLLRKEFRFT